MKLDTAEWKEFRIGRLFNVELSKGDIKADDAESGNIPLISSGESHNGVVSYISQGDGKAEIFNGNTVTVDMFCNAFYQNNEFYSVSHGRVNILLPRFNCTSYIGLFISTLISNEQYKYSYGRAVYSNVVANMTLKLPVQHNQDGSPVIDPDRVYSDDGYLPDWQYMEDYIKSLNCKPISSNVSKQSAVDLNIQGWGDFKVGDLFDIKKGKQLNLEDQTEGDTPYIGAISSNNGISNYIGQKPIHDGNTISLSCNGSIGEAFYQQKPFWASGDVNVLYCKNNTAVFNQYTALFICAILRREQYKYCYGRKWQMDLMNKTMIKLPIQYNPDGSPVIDPDKAYSEDGYIPDWQYMEGYIKSLPYSDRI